MKEKKSKNNELKDWSDQRRKEIVEYYLKINNIYESQAKSKLSKTPIILYINLLKTSVVNPWKNENVETIYRKSCSDERIRQYYKLEVFWIFACILIC